MFLLGSFFCLFRVELYMFAQNLWNNRSFVGILLFEDSNLNEILLNNTMVMGIFKWEQKLWSMSDPWIMLKYPIKI